MLLESLCMWIIIINWFWTWLASTLTDKGININELMELTLRIIDGSSLNLKFISGQFTCKAMLS